MQCLPKVRHNFAKFCQQYISSSQEHFSHIFFFHSVTIPPQTPTVLACLPWSHTYLLMRGTAGDQRPAFPFYRAFMLLGIPFYSRRAELRLKWAIGFRLPDSTAAAFVDDCTIRLYKLGIETLRHREGYGYPLRLTSWLSKLTCSQTFLTFCVHGCTTEGCSNQLYQAFTCVFALLFAGVGWVGKIAWNETLGISLLMVYDDIQTVCYKQSALK